MIFRISLLLITTITMTFAFKFDKWESGIELQDALEFARENNIPMTKGNDVLIRNTFDWRNLKNYQHEREFKYYTLLFGKKTQVRLYFTQASKKLYKIQLYWGSTEFHADKDEFETMLYELLDKKYGKRKIGLPSNVGEYILNKYRLWEPDDRTKVTVKRSIGSLQLIYLDNVISQEQEVVKKKKKLKMIMSDAPKI